MADQKPPTGASANDAKATPKSPAAGAAPDSKAAQAGSADAAAPQVAAGIDVAGAADALGLSGAVALGNQGTALAVNTTGAVAEIVADAAPEEEPEEGDEGEVTQKKKRGGILAALPFGGLGGGGSDRMKDADLRKRTWDLTIVLKEMSNVTTEKMLRVFFSVSICQEKNSRNYLKGTLPKFTAIYQLPKGDPVTLPSPLILWNRKKIKLSYHDLAKYCVQIDMWQVSGFTFNTYYGLAKRSFAKLVTREASNNVILQRKLTRAQLADKKMRKNKYDVATFNCVIQFEEYFKFMLNSDHWSMDMSKYTEQCKTLKEFKDRESKRKRLYFSVPPNKDVLVDRPGIIGGRPQFYFAKWNTQLGSMFWNEAGSFHFYGTRTDLRQSYFIISVYMGNPSQMTIETPSLQTSSPATSHATLLGKAMLTFTSILDITVLKGIVKNLKGATMQTVADLTGNMKCTELSIGMRESDRDIGLNKWTKLYGPGQPVVSGTVTHLNRLERHLVVIVKQCRDLPMSQPEKGFSNPYLRVKWDNMEQRCPRMLETLRPIFNFSFYFPVRSVFMAKLLGHNKSATSLWKQELLSKGPLKIEVWDDDIASSEFLGRTIVDIADIMNTKTKDYRTMLGEIRSEKKAGDEDDDPDPDEVPTPAKKQWYQEPSRTRIYDRKAHGASLLGSASPTSGGVPKIIFEAYFYDDLDQVKELEDMDEQGSKEDNLYLHFMRVFEMSMKEFQAEKYAIPFPNAVGAKDPHIKDKVAGGAGENLRRFTCMVTDPEGDGPMDLVPLMRFLVPIIVPEQLSHASDKIHWIHCLSWEPTSNRQTKTGLIPEDGWKPPAFILQTRRGAAQDHALVLCSLLKGAKMDAFICKGTMYALMPASEGQAEAMQLVEHVWVMTREDGWVQFWEPSNGKIYHLPKRCEAKKKDADDLDKKKKKHKKAQDDTDANKADEAEDAPLELVYEGEAPDAKIEQEDIEALPTTRRQPKAKCKVGQPRRAEIDTSAQKKLDIIKQRESLTIAPNHELLNKESTLINYLPYESIDVIFNDLNIWGNRQNHHPALIKYDIPEPDDECDPQTSLWWPYLKPDDIKTMQDQGIDIEPLGDKNVSLSRPLDSDTAAELRVAIRKELEENLRLYRSKLGFDCLFDKSDYVMNELESFLRIQELLSTLDPDSIVCKGNKSGLSEVAIKDPENEKYIMKLLHNKPYNKQGSFFMESSRPMFKKYRDEMKKRFKKLEDMVDTFRDHKEEFQVKRNHAFNGMTVHFSTSDVEDMRSYLMQIAKYKELIDVKSDDITYALQAIVVPLPARVQSVWVFIGAQQKVEEKVVEVKEF